MLSHPLHRTDRVCHSGPPKRMLPQARLRRAETPLAVSELGPWSPDHGPVSLGGQWLRLLHRPIRGPLGAQGRRAPGKHRQRAQLRLGPRAPWAKLPMSERPGLGGSLPVGGRARGPSARPRVGAGRRKSFAVSGLSLAGGSPLFQKRCETRHTIARTPVLEARTVNASP